MRIACRSAAVQWLAGSTGGDVVLAAPQRHVLRLLALSGRDHAFLIHASVQAAVAGPARSRGTVRRAAARGEHGMLWEGSAIAYWYPVIAVGAAAVRAGSLCGWMRGCRQPAHGRVGAGGRVCQLGTSRTASTHEQEA
jgi:hypothetical protein